MFNVVCSSPVLLSGFPDLSRLSTRSDLSSLFSEFSLALTLRGESERLEFSGLHCCLFVKVHLVAVLSGNSDIISCLVRLVNNFF